MRAQYDEIKGLSEEQVEEMLKPCVDIKKDEEIVT
jgi:hypothetical protein